VPDRRRVSEGVRSPRRIEAPKTSKPKDHPLLGLSSSRVMRGKGYIFLLLSKAKTAVVEIGRKEKWARFSCIMFLDVLIAPRGSTPIAGQVFRDLRDRTPRLHSRDADTVKRSAVAIFTHREIRAQRLAKATASHRVTGPGVLHRLDAVETHGRDPSCFERPGTVGIGRRSVPKRRTRAAPRAFSPPYHAMQDFRLGQPQRETAMPFLRFCERRKEFG